MLYPTPETFKELVLEEKVPVVIDFWAEWCAPCRAMAPIFEKVEPDYEGRLKFGKVNVDEYGDLASRYEIRAIPCLLVFHQGKLAERVVGMMREPQLRDRLDEILKGLESS